MRAFAAVLGICALLALGAFFWLSAGGEPSAGAAADLARPAPAVSHAAEQELGGLRTRVHLLEAELETVRDELAGLKVQRSAVELEPEPGDPAAAPAGAFLTDFSQRERQAVIDIVELERQRVAAERDASRDLRAEQRLRSRAQRIAERVGLAPGQDEALAKLWMEERRRGELLRDDFRAAGYTPAAREVLRDRQRELEDWMKAALEQGFGADTAAQLDKALRKENDKDKDKQRSDDEKRGKRGKRDGKNA